MTTEQFIKDKLYNSIYIEIDNKIFITEDQEYTRLCKLNSILNLPKPEYKPKEKIQYLFQLDYKEKYLWFNYVSIYSHLRINYNIQPQHIVKLITNVISKDEKLKSLKPSLSYLSEYYIYKS